MGVKDQRAQQSRENAALYVVVTIADNGVVHAWGEGPVHDPAGDQVTPFQGRTRARTVADRMRREERERKAEQDDTGHWVGVQVKVCKVLGIEPVEIKGEA
jgi:hypothetical protein